MANELKYTYQTQLTLEANGASAASNAMVPADDLALSSTNHFDYPMGDFVLKCDFGAAVGANVAVYLYRQDLNIDSTNDAPAPTGRDRGRARDGDAGRGRVTARARASRAVRWAAGMRRAPGR